MTRHKDYMNYNQELRPALETDIDLRMKDVRLSGTLNVPAHARGIVLFAHGSGSSRYSPRNRFVARVLQESGLGTLLMDLLTAEEEALDWRSGHLRFDINLLSERLVGAIDWIQREQQLRDLPIGCFGASTGAGAALVAAARRPEGVAAVVSRGGRPDLAGRKNLQAVKAPTLLIVGGYDGTVVKLNQEAMQELRCEKKLEIVSGATHLFEESGALEEVAKLAREWFSAHLRGKTDELEAA